MFASSIVPGLLATRKLNEDRGVTGAMRLFEIASIFHLDATKQHHESVSLGMIADVERDDLGYRALRGVVERLAHEIAAKPATITPTTSDAVMHPVAKIEIDGVTIGRIGFLTSAARATVGIEKPMIAAEIALDLLLAHWPPERPAAMLPTMPSVERDLSLIVDNAKRGRKWSAWCLAIGPRTWKACRSPASTKASKLAQIKKCNVAACVSRRHAHLAPRGN